MYYNISFLISSTGEWKVLELDPITKQLNPDRLTHSQLSALPVRELMAMLDKKGIDYQGVLEKDELLKLVQSQPADSNLRPNTYHSA